VLANPSAQTRRYKVRFERAGLIGPIRLEVTVPPASEKRQALPLSVAAGIPAGRHIIPGEVEADGQADPTDLFFVLVIPPGSANVR